MKKRPFFRITFGGVLSALLVWAFIQYAIPWILAYFGPPIASLFPPEVLQFFGIFWALAAFLRSGLRSGFLRFLIFIGVIALTCTYIYQNWKIPLADFQIQSIKPADTSQFVPDLDESTYVIQEEGLPPVAVLASLGEGDIADTIDQAVFSLPDWLLNQAQVIYIMEDSRFVQELANRNIHSSDMVAGFSNYSYMETPDGNRLSNNDCAVYLRVGSLDAETTAHELTHCFDFTNGITQRSADSPFTAQVQEIYTQNPYAISLYGAESVSEFFAEAGGLYITNPDALANRSPEMYAIFQQLYPSTSSS